MDNALGIKLEISDDILSTAPFCEHGPTVIYERQSKNGSSRRYYACSTIRNRKICPFYKLCSDKPKSQVLKITTTQSKFKYIGDSFFKLNIQNMYFCRNCELLFHKINNNDKDNVSRNRKRKLDRVQINEENSKMHDSHNFICCGSMINEPTLFVNPLNNSKSNAQYFYSDESCKLLCDMITFKITHVLFLATPRLFEYFRANYLPKLDKQILLMDIDDRFTQFYPKKLFCRFNLFNFYFYNDDEAKIAYKMFLSSAFEKDKSGGRLLIIFDPPFNAMVQHLMYSLNRIARDFYLNQLNSTNSKDQIDDIFSDSNYLPTIMTFPRFMHPRIQSYHKDIQILDFPITYTNHSKFALNSSPIRIYTINVGEKPVQSN